MGLHGSMCFYEQNKEKLLRKVQLYTKNLPLPYLRYVDRVVGPLLTTSVMLTN